MSLKKISIYILILGISGLLQSCELIEYHPYDGRVTGDEGLTAINIARIQEACRGKDTIRFAEISDTQRWYDETKALVGAINRHGGIDFVIHCGDQADFGLTKEFEWMRDIFAGFTMPYVCVIGNHDCLGTGEDVFHNIYGAYNYSFNAGFLHVLCLNTNAFEFDYSVAIPDFAFIKQDLDSVSDSTACTVVAMHARPYTEQFNNNIADYFNFMLEKYPGLRFCICGHDHHTTIDYPFKDGVPYYQCASANNKCFLVFTITRNSYTYEVVNL